MATKIPILQFKYYLQKHGHYKILKYVFIYLSYARSNLNHPGLLRKRLACKNIKNIKFVFIYLSYVKKQKIFTQHYVGDVGEVMWQGWGKIGARRS